MKSSVYLLMLGVMLTLFSCQKNPEHLKTVTSDADRQYLKNLVSLQHSFLNAGNHAAKTTELSDTTISLDSAENALEAMYNYFVCIPDVDRMNEHDGFLIEMSTTVEDSINYEEIYGLFDQIQDSLRMGFDSLAESSKTFSLVDIELIPQAGSSVVTAQVNYTISFGSTLNQLPTNDTTTVYLTYRDGLGGNDCGNGRLFNYPQHAGYYGQWQNVYYYGQAVMDFSADLLVSNSKNCNLPGAAVHLRSGGIAKYHSIYGSTFGYLLTNITHAEYGNMDQQTNIVSPYEMANLGNFNSTDLFYCDPPDDINLKLIFTGNSIHNLWINIPMINHYTNYVPNAINTKIPSGKKFRDMQIANTISLGMNNYIHWWYGIYYGSLRTIPDLNPIDKVYIDELETPILYGFLD